MFMTTVGKVYLIIYNLVMAYAGHIIYVTPV